MRTYGETIEVRTGPVEAVVEPVGRAAAAEVPHPSHVPSAQTSEPPAPFLVAPPAQFLWRGRLYLVREVLAHWVELGTWWTARAPRTSVPADPHAPEPGGAGAAYDPFGGSDGPPAVPRSVAADVGAVECEVWRVEAASGRTARVGVYDLVRDVPASGGAGPAADNRAGWRLARALD